MSGGQPLVLDLGHLRNNVLQLRHTGYVRILHNTEVVVVRETSL